MGQDWISLAAHPAVQSGAGPLVLACLLTGLLRLRRRKLGGLRGTGLAIGVAFLASVWYTTGVPPIVPTSAVHKLSLLILGGVAIGSILEFSRISSSMLRVSAVGLFLAASLWLALPQLQRDAIHWPVALVVLACGALIFDRAKPAERSAHESVPLLLAAAGIAGVSLVSGSLLIAQLATALAMANAGFLVWNWPHARDISGASVLLGATLPLMALALMTVLLTAATPWSLAPLAGVFFLNGFTKHRWLPRGRWREASQSLLVMALGAILISFAIALALMLAASPDDVYYR